MTRKKRPRRKFNLSFFTTKKFFVLLLISAIICIGLIYQFWPKSEVISVRGGVAIIDSFFSADSQFTNEAVAFFNTNGISVDIYKDEEVDVPLYMNLPKYGYKLIIFRVHAGLSEIDSQSTFLFTNELFHYNAYQWELATGQIKQGYINPEDPLEEPVFTVGPDFIESRDTNFTDSIIIVSSCSGLYNTNLAEAFINKGAKVFISWNEKVLLSHTDEACLLLLKTLLEDGTTIEETIRRVMLEIGPDKEYNSELKYWPKAANEVRVTI